MILFVLPIKVISETQHHQILSCTEVVAIGFLDLRSLYGIPYMLMGEQITHSEEGTEKVKSTFRLKVNDG